MKTTIDIADALLSQAKRAAERENTTLRALVERGLRQVLASPAQHSAPFRLRRVTFGGRGLQREQDGANWDRLRELAYEGRGA